MPKMSEISQENCVKIQVLHEQEATKVTKGYCEDCRMFVIANEPKSVRQPVTTSCLDHKLVSGFLKDMRKTPSNLAAAVPEETGITISALTTRKRLAVVGLRGCKTLKKSLLSKGNKIT